ncbi:threonine synthase [Paralimibaculum aggregatum]|uniref:Threonine synthase n=1 Tax=Paralimibaculum aggregatum TaxID=3036245 RepID=A0ABQ6LFR9_9RHOB|nr:threonine synthase [Limibaculum sp. NKW23]GMG81822.1 threonine synthase [Limibaculum sp. NKW23]
MRYISTRGQAPALPFEETMLTGLARDGGLYVPDALPRFTAEELQAMVGLPYEEVALRVMLPFVEDSIDAATFRTLIGEAYSGFGHALRCPLAQTGPNDWVLELHHGPTLAFKDVAMQLIGRLFEFVLNRRGERVTIVGATSGDTGSAAIEAFRGNSAADVFILFPHGRVSEVQRRQMTTPADANVHALAVEGDFDDCQALVKAMFNDFAFRDEAGLAAINSINWARVMAQTVYYFTAALALGAPGRPVSFSVPTGNFGDIYAGNVARGMGLPVESLVIATNENDILHRCMQTGEYRRSEVVQTTAPSMDIQVSSNFERAIFDALDHDAYAVAELMQALSSGGFTLGANAMSRLRASYHSARVSQSETAETIARIHAETGQILDPHSAIAVHGAAQVRGNPQTPMIALACAHAAKFPDAVEAACGIRPPLPPRLADLYEREERMTVIANDLAQIQSLIRERRQP